jgi:hypothetical protein
MMLLMETVAMTAPLIFMCTQALLLPWRAEKSLNDMTRNCAMDQAPEKLNPVTSVIMSTIYWIPTTITFLSAYTNCTKGFTVVFLYRHATYLDHIHPMYHISIC